MISWSGPGFICRITSRSCKISGLGSEGTLETNLTLCTIAAGAAISLVTAGLAFGASAAAQALNQQYSAANIQAGYRLYSAQCAVCHGGNGDAIAGVSLARQQFRRASTDTDIKTIARFAAHIRQPATLTTPVTDSIASPVTDGIVRKAVLV